MAGFELSVPNVTTGIEGGAPVGVVDVGEVAIVLKSTLTETGETVGVTVIEDCVAIAMVGTEAVTGVEGLSVVSSAAAATEASATAADVGGFTIMFSASDPTDEAKTEETVEDEEVDVLFGELPVLLSYVSFATL